MLSAIGFAENLSILVQSVDSELKKVMHWFYKAIVPSMIVVDCID
jgi:hypothetical protein